jgi:hypothetical protein
MDSKEPTKVVLYRPLVYRIRPIRYRVVGEGSSNGGRLEFEPMVSVEVVAWATNVDATTSPRDRISAFTDELMVE